MNRESLAKVQQIAGATTETLRVEIAKARLRVARTDWLACVFSHRCEYQRKKRDKGQVLQSHI